jgi:hypothetical protein
MGPFSRPVGDDRVIDRLRAKLAKSPEIPAPRVAAPTCDERARPVWQMHKD